MIREITTENYKSISKLKLSLGRVTVLIGENGSGKSNILEATTFASAASSNKLDNEFLVSRGIRVTDPQFMRSAFEQEGCSKVIAITIKEDNQDDYQIKLQHSNNLEGKWEKYLGEESLLSREDLDEINKIIEFAESLVIKSEKRKKEGCLVINKKYRDYDQYSRKYCKHKILMD